MTILEIPDKWKRLWDLWDLRVAVLMSLFFQMLLITIASLRRRTGNLIVTMFVWSAYLLADWIATLAVGLIGSSMGDSGKAGLDKYLITFWASFLLVHLGGPHNITAFSLEDNELWLRHMFQLFIHLIIVAYVFLQSFPNELWIPTILVYIAGSIKYFERTRSLYLASLGTLKTSTLPPPMAGSNYARLIQAYRSKVDGSVPVKIMLAETPKVEPPAYPAVEGSSRLKEIEVVESGHRFFNEFKGVIVDLTYGFREWQKTRESFFGTTAIDAFRILEVELNFLYDLLYTKMVVVHHKIGFILRFICLVFMVLALVIFVSHHKYHPHIHDIDIYITYTLLLGGIGLDIWGVIKLILSDWTIAALYNIWTIAALKNFTANLLPTLYNIRINLSFDKNYPWSRSVSQHSLISYCFKKRLKWINKLVYLFGAKDFLDEIQYIKTVHLDKDDLLKEFIFKELREKAIKANTSKDAQDICSWRGENVLSQAPRFYSSLAESVKVEYDESVLRWHVATELCYYTTEERDDKKDDTTEEKDDKYDYRKFCKIMSQYMLYLLIMRPTMMSEVTGIVRIRFQDTCEEAKKFFLVGQLPTKKFLGLPLSKAKKFFGSGLLLTRKKAKKFFGSGLLLTRKIRGLPMPPKEEVPQAIIPQAIKDACKKLLDVDTVVSPGKVKAGTSRSVLFDACIMAKDLQNFKEEKWKIMSEVWVELLSYAASHCRAHAHAQQLSKGGEFITFVWLLMFHFGMGEQFRVDPESRYKLIVVK